MKYFVIKKKILNIFFLILKIIKKKNFYSKKKFPLKIQGGLPKLEVEHVQFWQVAF